MDLSSMPFVRCFTGVKRSCPSGGASAQTGCTPTSSSQRKLQELGGGRGGLRLGLRPGQLEAWSNELVSLRSLPHPSKLGKRRSGSVDGGTADSSRKRRRRNDERPDVFLHLAQLRRKQHFETTPSPRPRGGADGGQEVPASPQLDTDMSFSLHGSDGYSTSKASVMTPSKDLMTGSPGTSRVLSFETDAEEEVSRFRGISLLSSDATSSSQVTEREADSGGESLARSATDASSGEVFDLACWEELVSDGETSFSVPSLDSNGADGLAEVPCLSHFSDSSRPHPLPPPTSFLSPHPVRPAFDPATFSIARHFPREE